MRAYKNRRGLFSALNAASPANSRDAKTMPENSPAARHLSEDRCQRAAVRCRRRAEAAKDETGKATWLTFAEEWLKLADEAEQSTERR